MLVFFDESFRESLSSHRRAFGVLCGIAIPEKDLAKVSRDIFQLKLKYFGQDFAAKSEIKGKDLLKNYLFKLEERGIISKSLSFTRELLTYIASRRLFIFGCVCFEESMHEFKCDDVRALDMTFRYIFERLDMFMKIKHPEKMAKIVFDDRDYGINEKNSAAITNFFQLSDAGKAFDSIVKTPFFAISQAQNVGLQLADLVTTVVGLRFASHPKAQSYFDLIKPCLFKYETENGYAISTLKVMRGYK